MSQQDLVDAFEMSSVRSKHLQAGTLDQRRTTTKIQWFWQIEEIFLLTFS